MLRVQIARLKRMSFGKSSEKLTREMEEGAQAYFDQIDAMGGIVGDLRTAGTHLAAGRRGRE